MKVTIDPELERFIAEQVEAGRFSSSDQALAAGIARLMLDAEPDVLDQQDISDIEQSLSQIAHGEVVDAGKLHGKIRKRLAGK